MTPDDFIRKWRGVTQTERATAQSHFIDLCRLLGLPDPIAADPQGVLRGRAGQAARGQGQVHVHYKYREATLQVAGWS